MAENQEQEFTPVPVPAMDAYIEQPIERAGYWAQLCEHVLRAEIVTQKNMEDAVSLDKMLQTAITKAEENRTFLVKPLNDHVKAINARFKPHTTDMKDARGIIQDKIKVFRAEAMRKAREIEERERKAREEAAMQEAQELEDIAREEADQLRAEGRIEESENRLAEGSGDVDEVLAEAVDGPAPAPAPAGPVRGDMGGVASFTDDPKWEVVDLAKVPKIYLTVDEKLVNQSVKKDGVREIPGLKIWVDQRMVNR